MGGGWAAGGASDTDVPFAASARAAAIAASSVRRRCEPWTAATSAAIRQSENAWVSPLSMVDRNSPEPTSAQTTAVIEAPSIRPDISRRSSVSSSPSAGISSQAIPYENRPMPPVSASTTVTTRKITGSRPKYRPTPPQTPPMTFCRGLRVSSLRGAARRLTAGPRNGTGLVVLHTDHGGRSPAPAGIGDDPGPSLRIGRSGPQATLRPARGRSGVRP